MNPFASWPKPVLAGVAGILAAGGVAGSLTQAASRLPTATPKTTETTTPKKKSAATTKQVTCKARLVATRFPIHSAENFGTTTCSAPLGRGVHHDTSTITRMSRNTGTFNGGLKLLYNAGTLRGTYTMSFTIANRAIAYSGTLKISSGTGRFRGVTGKGTITGTSSDGLHSAMNEKLALRMPRKQKR